MITVSEAGKLGGKAKTEAKQKASRDNGLLGGRPRKRLLTLNERGGINGCNIIYAPKGQAFEYAELSTNPYSGCGHKCAYCYVPKVLRMSDRSDFDRKAPMRTDFLSKLKRDAEKYQELGIEKQVMLSFTTDPYHPFDTSATRDSIKILKGHGLAVSILTKGGSRALRDLDLLDVEKDCFGSTLTSVSDDFSRKWESGAAVASDRIEALKKAHEKGFFTWVSIEPTIDVHEAKRVVKQTSGFVELYKVGRVNYSGITKTVDWESYTHEMIDLLAKTGNKHYIKKDLQPYLPENYYNPLRINQYRK